LLGAYAARTLNTIKETHIRSSRIYLERSDRNQAIRTAGYSVSMRVRDYLINPEPNVSARHRKEAEEEWLKTQAAVRAYAAVASASRLPALDQLKRELDRYWDVSIRTLWLSDEERRRLGYKMSAELLRPMREAFLDTLDEIRAQDQTELRENIRQSTLEMEALQVRLWMVIGISLLLGLLLAALTWGHLLRMEQAAKMQYEASVQNALEMEKLSQRLLDVQEEERRRLARELHDEVGQSLGAVLMDLGQARSAVPADEAEVAERLRSAHSLAESALRAVRNLSLLLRPSMLDDLGLVPALHWQARETSRRTGIDVHLTTAEEDLVLSDDQRTTIYRVVQEALQNAARHSRAREVEIVVQRHSGLLRIIVRDNGIGFDPSTTRGLGLLGMQERIALLNGVFQIESAPGQGTVLRMDIPAEVNVESEEPKEVSV
jgi:signal transduction histidine kinase